MTKRIALIPAYKPDEKMAALAEELAAEGFAVVIVNDGSGSGYNRLFTAVRRYADVVAHTQNMGKGAALKTGIRYISEHFEAPYVIVTADADGQHTVADICKTAKMSEENPVSLVLGCRAFDKDVPLRSRFGNTVTRHVFRLCSGARVSDTQTGLRAFGSGLSELMLCIDGDRYEYEMNVLMEFAQRRLSMIECPIETVYLDGNRSSHFSTVKDSARIYRGILSYTFGKKRAAAAAETNTERGDGKMKRFAWAAAFSAVLTAFTAYAVLDTFVIEKKLNTDATEMNTSMFAEVEKHEITRSEDNTATDESTDESTKEKKQKPSSDKTEKAADNEEKTENSTRGRIRHSRQGGSTEEGTPTGQTGSVTSDGAKTYNDDNMSITLSEYEQNGTAIYVADVQVTSAEYIKSAFAEDAYGRNITERTSEMAERVGAVLAINGDYYGARERGYVIRNGVVYRESSSGGDLLCLYADGTLRIVSSDEMSADELVDDGVWQAWDFGPALIEDGEIAVTEDDEVGKAMASNPRTAIGMIDSCHYLFVVSDGRTDESEGLSLLELAEFMKSLGAETAYNLDGGGSSTMVFQGEIVNNPTSGGSIKERSVSDMIYLG